MDVGKHVRVWYSIHQVTMKTEDSDISYLLKSPIGTVLCKGFAAVYNAQPEFPVSFLANWLLQQSKTQTSINQLTVTQQKKASKTRELSNLNKQKEERENSRQVEPSIQEKLQVLKTIMGEVEFKEDLLLKVLPNFIKEKEDIEACYIAELGNPLKKLEDDDEYVDDVDAPKVLKYVGASDNNRELMLGQVLLPEQGVSWDALKEDEENNENNEEESPEAIEQRRQRLKQVYIPDVLKEPRVHYFRLPKLGSYLCFQWPIQSYLVEEAFDKGGEKQREHNASVEEIKKEYEEKITEMKTELDEKEAKEGYLEDEAYINLKLEHEALVGAPPVLPILEFPFEKKILLFGCDTLGTDTAIATRKQENIGKILQEFKRIWQESERKSLVHDLEILAQYSNKVDHDVQKTNQELEMEAHSRLEKLAEKGLSEKDLKYEGDEAKLNQLKKYLPEKAKDYLKVYGSYNISKFPKLYRDLLLFAGYSPQSIDKQYNNLDWKQARHLTQQLTDRILQKVSEVNNRLTPEQQQQLSKRLSRLEKYDYEAVGVYNMGLWMLSQVVKRYIQLALLGGEIFQEKKEAYLKDRDIKLEEKERILQERAKALEDHISTLQEDARETFNETDWLVNYDTEHPIPVIEDIPVEYINEEEEREKELEEQRRKEEEQRQKQEQQRLKQEQRKEKENKSKQIADDQLNNTQDNQKQKTEEKEPEDKQEVAPSEQTQQTQAQGEKQEQKEVAVQSENSPTPTPQEQGEESDIQGE